MLSIRNLGFAYRQGGRETPILEDINLEIKEGEFLGVLGPSGSGKSTLFYILGCLLKAHRGTLIFDGQSIEDLRENELAFLRNEKVGFIFQQFHLLPGLSVLDNILLPGEYPSERGRDAQMYRARALELIERLGLTEVMHNRPNQLSGGQQQRVAIARALLKDVKLILADEPTGNLDSKNAEEVLKLLDELHRAGRTIVMITHDVEVAKRCSRIVRIRDGRVQTDEPVSTELRYTKIEKKKERRTRARSFWSWKPQDWTRFGHILQKTLPLAAANLKRNKTKTFLTMLGVIVGIAAVQAMITFGEFVKARVLESYSELGVDRITVYGYQNWDRKATDAISANFTSFESKRDLEPLYEIFPEFVRGSPVLRNWQGSATYAGKTVSEDVRLVGGNEDYLTIDKREISQGRPLSPYNVINHDPVCLIGSQIEEKLFQGAPALGAILFVGTSSGTGTAFPCRVIGVMAERKSSDEWSKPNSQIFLPYTYFQSVVPGWASFVHELDVEARPGSDIEGLSKGVKAYFKLKYGAAGQFHINEGAVVLEQMKKFLTLFTLLLTSIAGLSLIIGGIGINNMMLVSVSERLREIGIRKALGATNASVRFQLLTESVLICVIAGLIGVTIAFTGYETIIFLASKFVSKVKFEWIFNVWAFIASVVSIMLVGVASGVVPALKAERIQVIEALRSE